MDVITVTEKARQRIQHLCATNAKYAVHLGVKGGGCAGYSYDWGFADRSEVLSSDVLIEFDKGALMIDAASVMYVMGTELDFVDEVFGARFEIRNPNAKSSCGCGESINFEKEVA